MESIFQRFHRANGLMSLPDELFSHIMSFLTYDDCSRVRAVCTRFNEEAQRILNQGYYKAENFHTACVRKVKEQLPRRESERRKHPLWVNCDVLSTTESQLSLLGMTFMRRSDISCCFIPGKVLDEIFRILRLMYNATAPVQNNESLLQELRDISSMAMEHFDEKIVPMRSQNREGEKVEDPSSHDHSNLRPVLGEKVAKLKVNYIMLKKKYSALFKEKHDLKKKMIDFRKKMLSVKKQIKSQNGVIIDQGVQITSQAVKIDELCRKLAEYDNTSETVIHIKEEHCSAKAIGHPKARLQNKIEPIESPRRSARLLKRCSMSEAGIKPPTKRTKK